MGKVLVVAEKPSVARDIARVLGVKPIGDGAFIGERYVVTYALGHLLCLCNPEDIDEQYKSWSMKNLPIIPEKIPLKPIAQSRAQLKIIQKWMKDKEIESLICATDSGREGELIFRLIYEHAKCKKPFSRLWISSMTDEAIGEGLANLRPSKEYDNLFKSAKCRSESDWLVGMNASRAYSVTYHARLSVGRVQTPTLALMVERQKEIDDFVPEIYFELMATFDAGYDGIWRDENKNSRISQKEKADAIAKKIKGKTGNILSIERKRKKVLPPLLYDLTELQREANRRFGLSAKTTLQIAQALYERYKLTTYPRTDSRYLSHDLEPKLTGILQKIKGAPYTDLIAPLLEKPLSVTSRIIDDSKVTDHHAIIPTGQTPRGQLSEIEQKVFDLIVRRFIAVFYPEQVIDETEIITAVETETFYTKGKIEVSPGFMAVYRGVQDEKEEDEKDEEGALPPLTQGQAVCVDKTKVAKKETKPPKPYTEATLLTAMEHAGRQVEDEKLKEQMKERGLGTPATRAAIIERLLDVQYIVRQKKALLPTDKAMRLISILPKELTSAEMTAKWELALSRMAKGDMAEDKFMESIGRFVRFIVENAGQHRQNMVFEQEEKGKKAKAFANKEKTPQEPLGICPLCGKGQVLENSKAFYCTQWKDGCKFTVWKNVAIKDVGRLLCASDIKQLLQEGRISIACTVLNIDKFGKVEINQTNREVQNL